MAQHNYIECLFVNNTQSEYDNCWCKTKKKFWYWNNMWKNTFTMPIIAKMSALITSVGTFICTCRFSSVPSTTCDVYFVWFVFVSCSWLKLHQFVIKKAGKAKTIPEASQDGWRSDCVCMFLFTLYPLFCSHLCFYMPLPYFRALWHLSTFR